MVHAPRVGRVVDGRQVANIRTSQAGVLDGGDLDQRRRRGPAGRRGRAAGRRGRTASATTAAAAAVGRGGPRARRPRTGRGRAGAPPAWAGVVTAWCTDERGDRRRAEARRRRRRSRARRSGGHRPGNASASAASTGVGPAARRRPARAGGRAGATPPRSGGDRDAGVGLGVERGEHVADGSPPRRRRRRPAVAWPPPARRRRARRCEPAARRTPRASRSSVIAPVGDGRLDAGRVGVAAGREAPVGEEHGHQIGRPGVAGPGMRGAGLAR